MGLVSLLITLVVLAALGYAAYYFYGFKFLSSDNHSYKVTLDIRPTLNELDSDSHNGWGSPLDYKIYIVNKDSLDVNDNVVNNQRMIVTVGTFGIPKIVNYSGGKQGVELVNDGNGGIVYMELKPSGNTTRPVGTDITFWSTKNIRDIPFDVIKKFPAKIELIYFSANFIGQEIKGVTTGPGDGHNFTHHIEPQNEFSQDIKFPDLKIP